MRLTNYRRNAFVRAVLDDVPSIDYQEQAQKYVQTIAIEQMPKKMRVLYDDKGLRGFLKTEYVNACKGYVYVGPSFSLTAEQKAHADQLIQKRDQQREQRKELSNKLEAIAKSCATVAALAKALPELEKYMPAEKEEKLSNLPVVANVVTDLMKAGWPKGVQHAG